MYRLAKPAIPQLGMGACCSSCAHGGECDSKKGLGLFDSGMDFTTWGIPEWGIVVLGGYMLFSTVVFTTKRAASAVKRIPGNRRKKRAEYHRTIARRLSSKSGGGLF